MPPPKGRKTPDAKSQQQQDDDDFTAESRIERLENGLDHVIRSTGELKGLILQMGAERGDRTPTPGGADLGIAGNTTPKLNLRSLYSQSGSGTPTRAPRPSAAGVTSRTGSDDMLDSWMAANRRTYAVGSEVTPGTYTGMDKTTYASDAEAARDIFSKFTAAMGSQCAFAKVLAATPVRVILEMLVEHAAFVRSRGEVLEDAEQKVVALALDLLNATDDKADLVAELEHYDLPRIDSRMPTLYKFMRLLNGNGMAANRAFKDALRKRESGCVGLVSETPRITTLGVSGALFESMRLVCPVRETTGDSVLKQIKDVGAAVDPDISIVANFDKVVRDLNTVIRDKDDYLATHDVDLNSAAYKVDLHSLASLAESWSFSVGDRVTATQGRVLATYTGKLVADAMRTVGDAGSGGRFVSPEHAAAVATGLRDAAAHLQCDVVQALQRQGDSITAFGDLVIPAGTRASRASTVLGEAMALRAGAGGGFQPDPAYMSVTMQGLPDAVRWQAVKDFTGVHHVPAAGVVQKARGVFTLFYKNEQEAAAAVAAMDKKPFWTTQVRVTTGGASARSSRIQPEPFQHPSFTQNEVSFFDRGWEIAHDPWGEPGSGSLGSGSGDAADAGVIGPGPSLAGPDDGGGGDGASAAARKASVVPHQEWTFGNEKFDDFRDLLNSAVEDNATLTLTANGSEIEAELKQAVLCPGSAGLRIDESM